MSDSKLFWYHCGRCGALFQAEAGLNDERVCMLCGADPRPPTVEAAAPTAATATSSRSGRTKSGTHGGRKPRRRRPLLKLVLGWTLFLALILIAARYFSGEPQVAETSTELSAASAGAVLDEDEAEIMQTAGHLCSGVFQGFLAASTPEQRSQYVLSPFSTVVRMSRFYSMNPLPGIAPESLKIVGGGTVRLPVGIAYQIRWESQDGEILDTVFRRESDEWRLDWDHFAPYSEYPWSLFIAGSGPNVGEFRLLARERLAEERKAEPTMSLVLYAPRFGRPSEVGFQSPEFLVPRDSSAGRLLAAAFKLAQEGGRVYGGQLEQIAPDGMVRVRVKVRRYEEDQQRKFEISEVLACHWIAVDDPGVELLVPPESAEE